MKENKLTIRIHRPCEVVFEYTTNPVNTSQWIDFVAEEIAEQYPPVIGTLYKNHAIASDVWDVYKVKAYIVNELFTLTDSEGSYHVQYTYRAVDDTITELEYYEWMEDGILSNSFSYSHLERLKKILESK